MTNDLVAFLRARLDEVERVEQDKWTLGEWVDKPCPVCEWPVKSYSILPPEGDRELNPCQHRITIDEFNAWAGANPAADPRVLRDVEAKRQIIDLHEGPHVCPKDDNGMESFWTRDDCPTVRLFGSEFADHPEYREEWRP